MINSRSKARVDLTTSRDNHIIIIIINRHFRNAQLTMNRHKGARGDAEPGLTLIQVRFQ